MPPFILNIPNTITIIRLLMIPMSTIPLLPVFGSPSIGILIFVNVSFVLASVTDFLDGYLARKLNQLTEWGAYMDPLIDKYLIWVMYFVFLFIPELKIPWWTFLLIIFRDIMVTKMRKYALKNNLKFKTSFLAKCKTAIQMIIGSFILLFLLITAILNTQLPIPYPIYFDYWQGNSYSIIPSILVQLVSVFTFITGIDYTVILLKEIKK